MLCITRMAGESLLIGEHIRVKVYEIRGGKVRLAIVAPRDVNIVREEIAGRTQSVDRQIRSVGRRAIKP